MNLIYYQKHLKVLKIEDTMHLMNNKIIKK